MQKSLLLISKISIFTLLVLVVSSCKTIHSAITNDISLQAGITVSHTRLNKHTTSINRLTEYVFAHPDVPHAFDGKTILFISDLHYPSLFEVDDLAKLGEYIKTLDYDILCLGGDFHEDVSLIAPLFEEFKNHIPKLGAYAVLGNNDYERGYNELVEVLKENEITLLEHKVATIKHNKDKIHIAGVRNPFDLKNNGVSPTKELSNDDLVILLSHTPDYAEDVAIDNTDLVLAGHTHGGQVRVFGRAPIVPSKYDQRFLTGLVYNTAGIPILVTNGIGTSNKKVRVGAPAEVMLIHLRKAVNVE